jgi:hypothetical protein
MNAFCASENFEAFIVFRSSQPGENNAENSSSERPSFRGADHNTTANVTTDLVAEWIWDGPVVFRVGPSNNSADGLVPDKTLDGVQAREILAVRVWWA